LKKKTKTKKQKQKNKQKTATTPASSSFDRRQILLRASQLRAAHE
jgi:hypothetical protein